MFHISRFPSGACEIRVDFQGRRVEEIPSLERRAFMRLGPDLAAVNAWLAALAADTGCAAGTVYEYAKTLLYALEWLAQEPLNLATKQPAGHSLLHLSPGDIRSLMAWLDIPAHQQAERAHLARSGTLPVGFRQHALSPATHNRHAAALTAFYDWVIFEYRYREGASVELTMNPLKDWQRPLSHFQLMKRPGGLLARSVHGESEPSHPFRKRQPETAPVALTPDELQHVLRAIPSVSHGHNAANRNGALVRLLLWGMLREDELIGSKWEALDRETLWVKGKGGKRRAVPIVDVSTWGYLEAYTNALRIPLEQRFHGPLLRQLDHEDRPITRHTVEHLMLMLKEHFSAEAAAAARGGNPAEARSFEILGGKLHSHIFRATGATYMAKAGMSLIMLSLLLGHSSPNTTMRYYIAAEQLDLTEEVQRIFERISAASAATSAVDRQHAPADARSWYRRQGMIRS
jgi:integrase